ncbi:MAG: aldose 1-epimerase [Leclercia sp.]
MADTLLIENAYLRMRVNPQGGGLQALFSVIHGQPVLWEGGDSALFPMLPLANRVAGNCFQFQGREIRLPQSPVDEHFFLHGDGWQACWEVASLSDTACVLTLRSQHDCGFDYQAMLRYQLRDHVLRAELTLTHLGQQPMLYGLGFHPWFDFDARSRLQFLASGYWPEGEHHLPLAWQDQIPRDIDFSRPQQAGDRWLNIGYSGWNGVANITRDVMKVTISAQTPWLMLFRMSGGSFLCLEPQSHPVNAHQMAGQPGLVALGPGDCTHFAMEIAVETAARDC